MGLDVYLYRYENFQYTRNRVDKYEELTEKLSEKLDYDAWKFEAMKIAKPDPEKYVLHWSG
jgi:hypothetical protein